MKHPFRLYLLVFLFLIAFELITVLMVNHGHLIYTLDDAYIHLRLAEQIWHGHYGLNQGEAAAPASSILWPFLLAPFSVLPDTASIPLLINILAAAATLLLYHQFALTLWSAEEGFPQYAGILALLLMIATNLIGLIFTGMEHALQILLVTVLVLGLIQEVKMKRVNWWLVGAIILGPLIRYENLAISLPALLYLALRRHIRVVLMTGLIMMLVMGGFSVFLYALNLGILPTSVLIKSAIGNKTTILENFNANFLSREGAMLSLGMLLMMALALATKRPIEERLLALCTALSITLHLFFGRYGWFHRYEIYIWTWTLLMTMYLYRNALKRLLTQQVSSPFFLLFAGLAITCPGYLETLINIPIASNNIYEQQYQMHRFATDYYRAPVAVNDMGLVTYQNPNYVLDLVGMASLPTLFARQIATDPGWMNEAAGRHQVRMAMIYEAWFEKLPENWTPIGDLYLGKMKITPAEDKVTFYAFDRETLQRVRALLEDFQRTLPEGVEFQFRAQRP